MLAAYLREFRPDAQQEPLDDVLRRIALEVGRLAREGDRLQACVGALALRSADPDLAADLQSIDRLVRSLNGLARFITEVAEQAPADVRLDIGRTPGWGPADAFAVRR